MASFFSSARSRSFADLPLKHRSFLGHGVVHSRRCGEVLAAGKRFGVSVVGAESYMPPIVRSLNLVTLRKFDTWGYS